MNDDRLRAVALYLYLSVLYCEMLDHRAHRGVEITLFQCLENGVVIKRSRLYPEPAAEEIRSAVAVVRCYRVDSSFALAQKLYNRLYRVGIVAARTLSAAGVVPAN